MVISLAAAALGSAAIGAGAGLFGGRSSDKASAKAAARANQFTERQMKSRHQWEVEDLKAAGLNPILSAGAAPSMGSSAKADVTNKADAMSKGTQAVLSSALLKSQINNINADTSKKTSEMNTTDNQGALLAQEWKIKSSALAQSKIDTDWAKSKFGRFFGAIDKAGRSINPMTSSASQAMRFN